MASRLTGRVEVPGLGEGKRRKEYFRQVLAEWYFDTRRAALLTRIGGVETPEWASATRKELEEAVAEIKDPEIVVEFKLACLEIQGNGPRRLSK